MNSLEVRRQFLLAESELNRANLARDLTILQNQSAALAGTVESIWVALSSIVSGSAAGFRGLRYLLKKRGGGGKSWLSTLVRGAKAGASLWSAFRSCDR